MLMITETGDGLFRVVKVTETCLGTFHERPYAEVFRDAMKVSVERSPQTDEFSGDDGRGAPPDPATGTQSDDAVATAVSPMRFDAPLTSGHQQALAEPRTEDDISPQQAAQLTVKDLGADALAALVARLDAGENLQEVAASAGVAWASLRGSYTNVRRHRQAQVTDTAECKMCGKEFLPSLNQPETCARCSREVA